MSVVVDRAALDRRIYAASHLMAAHGGKLQLDDISDDGVVRVRFMGLCTACPLRPLTFGRIVRPALADVDGVTAVEAVGVRMSEEAERRLLGEPQV